MYGKEAELYNYFADQLEKGAEASKINRDNVAPEGTSAR